ncbi:MAG TPA: zf-HC2 domain-containing protein [Acidimicrobiia bacterium]|jgi:anti-sigma factor RsiW|nr:zf-HC2 domain-containing protein [Acidimicrobiia bacterium]
MTHLDEVLSAYLDGEATPDEVRRVDRHTSECLQCRRRLRAISDARAAVRSLPTLELPLGLVPVAETAPGKRRRVVWMGAAAAALAGLVTAAAIFTPAPEPIDLSDLSRQVGARAALDPGSGPLKIVLPGGLVGE